DRRGQASSGDASAVEETGCTPSRKPGFLGCYHQRAMTFPAGSGQAPASPWPLRTFRLSLAALVPTCLVVWHISLLWLYREEPWGLGRWLLGVFVLVVVARGLARRVALERRTALV